MPGWRRRRLPLSAWIVGKICYQDRTSCRLFHVLLQTILTGCARSRITKINGSREENIAGNARKQDGAYPVSLSNGSDSPQGKTFNRAAIGFDPAKIPNFSIDSLNHPCHFESTPMRASRH